MSESVLLHVERLLDTLSVEEQLTVIENLSHRLKQTIPRASQRKPAQLYGTWKEYFPEDFDLDAALYKIRHEWEKEWENLESGVVR